MVHKKQHSEVVLQEPVYVYEEVAPQRVEERVERVVLEQNVCYSQMQGAETQGAVVQSQDEMIIETESNVAYGNPNILNH